LRDLWEWQKDELQHALAPARALFWDPRTGKTQAIIEQIAVWFAGSSGGTIRILIVAPKQVCGDVWSAHLSTAGYGRLVTDISGGAIVDRIQKVQALKSTDKAIVLINWDVLSRKDMLAALLRWAPQVVVADEMHYAKSAGAGRSRALHRLAKLASIRRGLTGTPTPEHYIDLYAQYKFLDQNIFGTRKSDFIDRYVNLDYWGRPESYKRLPELRDKMYSIASRVDRKIVWADRSPLEIVRRLTLPPQARRLYDTIVKESIASFQGVDIDATHKLTQIIKLQQLTAGFVRDGEHIQWVHTSKIDAALAELRDLLESGQKVVLYYRRRRV
jgi:hypothetical protein